MASARAVATRVTASCTAAIEAASTAAGLARTVGTITCAAGSVTAAAESAIATTAGTAGTGATALEDARNVVEGKHPSQERLQMEEDCPTRCVVFSVADAIRSVRRAGQRGGGVPSTHSTCGQHQQGWFTSVGRPACRTVEAEEGQQNSEFQCSQHACEGVAFGFE